MTQAPAAMYLCEEVGEMKPDRRKRPRGPKISEVEHLFNGFANLIGTAELNGDHYGVGYLRAMRNAFAELMRAPLPASPAADRATSEREAFEAAHKEAGYGAIRWNIDGDRPLFGTDAARYVGWQLAREVAAPPADRAELAEIARWMHAAYDRPPQTPEVKTVLASIDALARSTDAPSEPREKLMSLVVALDFAENPRPKSTMQAPADTVDELREALRVVAEGYRSLATPPAAAAKLETTIHLEGEGPRTITAHGTDFDMRALKILLAKVPTEESDAQAPATSTPYASGEAAPEQIDPFPAEIYVLPRAPDHEGLRLSAVVNGPGPHGFIDPRAPKRMAVRYVLAATQTPAVPAAKCLECGGAGVTGDAGDDGRTVLFKCVLCNGSGRAVPATDAPDTIVNHDEAYQLACMKAGESNLARCYLALRATIAPAEASSEAQIDAAFTIRYPESANCILNTPEAKRFMEPAHIQAMNERAIFGQGYRAALTQAANTGGKS